MPADAGCCKIVLKNHPSRCEERQAIIVSKDDGHEYKHVAYNDSGGRVRQYKIDGEVLPKGKVPERCDFMLLTEDTEKPTAYLIELKGSPRDADQCISQVQSTERLCRDALKGYQIRYRFVFGTGQGVYSSKFITWRDKLRKADKGKLISKRNVIEEHF